VIGVIFLICAFPVLWNNERKQVKVGQFLKKAEAECVDIRDIKYPDIAQNFRLTYGTGETSNE
jgi:hypothetical protein